MKRLICFFDGTWETADHPVYTSNIVKLKRAIPPKSPDDTHQISYYRDGYGVDGGWFSQYLGAAIGYGLDEEIRDTYRFLAQNHSPGDEIYIFGYSRGAFQARSLASFISLCGLLDSENLHLLNRAWECYVSSAGREEDPGCVDIRAAGDYPVPISCLGVFDTVGNLGVPGGLLAKSFNRRFQFHNTGLQPSIRVALQALAIDEFRAAFRPSLWAHPEGTKLPEGQIVEQVWFPGVHADVGGGFADASLSDGALLWMAERVRASSGLAFNTDHLQRTTAPNPLGPQNRIGGPLYHFDRLFPFVRVVGGMDDVVSRMRRRIFRHWRIGKLPKKHLPINEDIHDSAIRRYGKTVQVISGSGRYQIVYKPANLRAVIRRQAEQARQERWQVEKSGPIVLKRRQILEDAIAEAEGAFVQPEPEPAPPQPMPLEPAHAVSQPAQPAPAPSPQQQQPKRVSLGSGPVSAEPITLTDDEKVA